MLFSRSISGRPIFHDARRLGLGLNNVIPSNPRVFLGTHPSLRTTFMKHKNQVSSVGTDEA